MSSHSYVTNVEGPGKDTVTTSLRRRQKSKSTQKLEYQKACCGAVSHRKVCKNMMSQW